MDRMTTIDQMASNDRVIIAPANPAGFQLKAKMKPTSDKMPYKEATGLRRP
jgi:hypothetical protein